MVTWTSAHAVAARARHRRDDLDQCPATLATVGRRLALLGRHDRDILLLGDDDLLGLALAHTDSRSRITIVDADPVILSAIRRHAPHGRIELVRHDLTRPLPRALRGQFDDVFTDPPYTVAGQIVFALRAVVALRAASNASLYLCASRTYLGPSQLRRVRGVAVSAGLALRGVHRGINRYSPPPDVKRDLTAAGCSARWLSSDVFHYVRRHAASPPSVPRILLGRLYDYATPW